MTLTPLNRLSRLSVTLVVLAAAPASADEAMSLRNQWTGNIDFHVTGAPLAVDGPDADTTRVDILLPSADVSVTSADVPVSATLVQVFLYWTGSTVDDGCTGAMLDRTVDFTAPGASAVSVTADRCACSLAGAASYDVQSCRADVTSLITGAKLGTYTVGGFNARITNSATDNASFALVFIYADSSVAYRTVGLYDGLETMSNNSRVLTFANVKIGTPAQGKLAWYVAEGDIGGSAGEQVLARSVPTGTLTVLSDAVNPPNNPMNHTVNTVSPPRTDTLGMDLDEFDITSALSSNDTAVEMTYAAGDDKHWLVFNLVGLDIFEARFSAKSSKTATLHVDADGNGVPSVGDTVRYVISLENTGNAPGYPDLTDVIPPQAASWSLVSAGGGTNASTASTLIISDIPVPVGQTSTVVIDVVLADVADNTTITNVANYDARPIGDFGPLTSPTLIIRRDRDGDGIFDTQDNCPDAPNADQRDADGDGKGDVCDPCPLDAPDDLDGDGVCQSVDNCPSVPNPGQEDADSDGVGDVCDACPQDVLDDTDGDGVCDSTDNCVTTANADQTDSDGDGRGDACDVCPNSAQNDGDNDGVCEPQDNCPTTANPDQQDADGDGLGDLCDACPLDPANDEDQDGLCADVDNCPSVANPDQVDRDDNGVGDACEERIATVKPGCDCGSGGDPVLFAAFVMILARLSNRRRRRDRH